VLSDHGRRDPETGRYQKVVWRSRSPQGIDLTVHRQEVVVIIGQRTGEVDPAALRQPAGMAEFRPSGLFGQRLCGSVSAAGAPAGRGTDDCATCARMSGWCSSTLTSSTPDRHPELHAGLEQALGISKVEAEQKAKEQLERWAGRQGRRLSRHPVGCQKQRVAIARALVMEPKIHAL